MPLSGRPGQHIQRDYRTRFELATRHSFTLVAGGYVVLNIFGFRLLSLLLPEQLASGDPLARAVCGFIIVFWGIRLLIQLFIFDAKRYLRNRFLTIGYHGLRVVFAWQTFVYGFAAIGRWPM